MVDHRVLNLYYLKDDNEEIRIKELARVCPGHLFKIGYAPLECRFTETINDIFHIDILKDLFKMPKSNVNYRVGFKRIKKELWKMYTYLSELNNSGIRYVKVRDLISISINEKSFEQAKATMDKLQTVRKESWYESKHVNSFKVGTVFNAKVKAITNDWIALCVQDPYLYEQECVEIMIETCEYILNSKDPKNYFVKVENM